MIIKQPAYWATNRIFINGSPKKRLMVVFKTFPCRQILDNKRCLMCGFDSHYHKNDSLKLLSQFRYIKNLIFKKKIEHLDFLSSGSLLDENQVEPMQIMELISEVKKISFLKSIMIEGRTEFCNPEKLTSIKRKLGNIHLEYGIGLEACSDYFRNRVLKKGLKFNNYLKALENLSLMDIGICTYLLAGIPAINAKKSLEETKRSILKIAEIYRRLNSRGRIALFPIFIAPNTQLEKMYKQGKYHLMKFDMLANIINDIKDLINFKKSPLYIGLDDEGISQNRHMAFFLPKKYKKIIEDFNLTQNASAFRNGRLVS